MKLSYKLLCVWILMVCGGMASGQMAAGQGASGRMDASQKASDRTTFGHQASGRRGGYTIQAHIEGQGEYKLKYSYATAAGRVEDTPRAVNGDQIVFKGHVDEP